MLIQTGPKLPKTEDPCRGRPQVMRLFFFLQGIKTGELHSLFSDCLHAETRAMAYSEKYFLSLGNFNLKKYLVFLVLLYSKKKIN